MRPTATQAVVISRPLIQVRRVTPSSTAHKNIPMAPGRKAIGEVREFKVVPDHLGRGRELVDVTKNKDDSGAARSAPTEKDGAQSKQEIDDLVWGRVAIPIRGKKKKPTKKGAEDPDHRDGRREEGHQAPGGHQRLRPRPADGREDRRRSSRS